MANNLAISVDMWSETNYHASPSYLAWWHLTFNLGRHLNSHQYADSYRSSDSTYTLLLLWVFLFQCIQVSFSILCFNTTVRSNIHTFPLHYKFDHPVLLIIFILSMPTIYELHDAILSKLNILFCRESKKTLQAWVAICNNGVHVGFDEWIWQLNRIKSC